MSVCIVYGDSLTDRRPGSLITPDAIGWRREAAYYLTLPDRVLIRATCAIACVRCKGKGQVRRKLKGRRKPAPWMTYTECTYCAGYGYIGETILDHRSVRAEEYT